MALLRGGWSFGRGSGVFGGLLLGIAWLWLNLGFAFVCGG